MAVNDARKEWLEARRQGIGGSEIAAIVGVSKWRAPIDVWASKTGRTPQGFGQPDDDPTNQFLWWGTALEPLIARRYSVETGYDLIEDVGIVHHAEHSVLLGSPDRLVKGMPRGLEIKNSGYKGPEWGQPGTDQIPEHYLLQCAWYMAVCDLNRWDLAVLFGGNRCEIFTIHRNAGLEDFLLEAGLRFWRDYVVTDREPPVDSTERYGEYLAQKFATGNQEVITAPPELVAFAEQLYAANRFMEFAETKKREALNQLAAFIGQAKGTKHPNFKVTWVRSKPTSTVDFKSAFYLLLETAASKLGAEAIEAGNRAMRDCTTTSARRPYLRATFKTEPDPAELAEQQEAMTRSYVKELTA